MIHFCMVKYGWEVQGEPADEYVRDLVEPVYENCKDIKFHLLTDRRSDVIPEYVNYINLDLDDIKKHEHWVKTYFFDPDFIGAKEEDQTIVVDIDMVWNQDPNPVIEWPVEKNQFVSMNRWWRDNDVPISGNFYKFNSHDFKEVKQKYLDDWQNHRKYYYENGYCTLPNMGEQYFIYDMVKDREIILQPPEYCMKIHDQKIPIYKERFDKLTGKDYFHSFHYEAIWHYKAIK